MNDGVIALGIYSFSGREVSTATVAAFLTIIGYSIYDTIIIFDRVRKPWSAIDGQGDHQHVALGDSPTVLATTIITLRAPVAALYALFGETVLQGFAFAI